MKVNIKYSRIRLLYNIGPLTSPEINIHVSIDLWKKLNSFPPPLQVQFCASQRQLLRTLGTFHLFHYLNCAIKYSWTSEALKIQPNRIIRDRKFFLKTYEIKA